ncbi:MAG: hypothetical protein K6G40_07925 [Eubacterium sp.]|nr:hypothetical protein [Eubacterium sp.]
MAFKKAADFDSTKFREQLSEIRTNVAESRKKRLAKESSNKTRASFKSGQDKFKNKFNRSDGSGQKRW